MKIPPYKHRLQVALALTLLACSGLAGCSDSQEQSVSSSVGGKAAVATANAKTSSATPKANSTATGTPTATTSPTATLSPELEAARKQARDSQPPVKPELITINSEDGAIATAKYWLQLYYYTYISGNTSQYKELCPGSNDGCAGVIREATKSYTEGGWLSPVNIKLNKVYRRDDLSNSMVIQINYEHNDFDQYRGDGSATHYGHAERGVIVELSYQNNHWIVVRQKNEKFK